MWGSDIVVGVAEETEDAAERDNNHVEGSKAEEVHIHQERPGMLEVQRSDGRG